MKTVYTCRRGVTYARVIGFKCGLWFELDEIGRITGNSFQELPPLS